jgi:iron complex outermembrane recepter protein
MKHPYVRVRLLPFAIAAIFATTPAMAQDVAGQGASPQNPPSRQNQQTRPRASVSTTSNTTTQNATKLQELSIIQVSAQALSLGGGLMSLQTAPKAVSTITRDAIAQAAPGATFVQMVDSIPGVVAATDDVTGLNDGNYSIRGYTNDEIGVTVNGAPVNDSGSYRVYSTEYGDTENMGDITVLQGYPDVDQPVAGAAGGTIAWATINPTATPQVDLSLTGGSNSYQREFVRVNTGDTGPVRSWLSYSNNKVDLWRGSGNARVTKIDGKSVLTLGDTSSITASLQYNREIKYGYEGLTQSQAAQNYDANWDSTLEYPLDTNYWKLHTNPFRSWLFSLDGEFQLSDNLHLTIVPYFQYGSGGGGSGKVFYESTYNDNAFGDINKDLNGNGIVDRDLAYGLSRSYTWRPGVIAKLNQYFGENDSLEYGVWFDRPRQEQSQVYTPTEDGAPADVWTRTGDYLIRYPDGAIQYNYLEYTKTKLDRAFVTNTWTPNEQWTLTAGAAYTWVKREGYDFQQPGSMFFKTGHGGIMDATYSDFTPTVGLKYQPDDRNQFYIGYGKTFRAPVNGAVMQNLALVDYYQQNPNAMPLTPAQFAQLENNKPETSNTVDVGWRYYAGNLSASLDAYASNLRNKQVSGYDNSTGDTVYVMLPGVHMRGVNGEISYKITPNLTIYGSYAYTKSTLRGQVDAFGDGIYVLDGKTFIDAPKNSGFVRLNYENGRFWGSFDAKYRGAIWGDWYNTERVGGYTTFNLSTGWHFQDFAPWFTRPSIKINVFNLTNHKAFAYANSNTLLATYGYKDPNGVTLYASAPYYILLQPRTYMVTLSASFR